MSKTAQDLQVQNQQKESQETLQQSEPISLKAALIRLLPQDYPTLYGSITGLIILVACVIMAFVDYSHSHDLEHFLLLLGFGGGGWLASTAIAKRYFTKSGKLLTEES